MALDTASGSDTEVAATIALQSAVHHFGRLDGSGTVEWCRRALELAAPDSAIARSARTYLAHGLGYAVVSALQAMRPERMFAYVLFVGVLAIALNACLVHAERWVLRGYGGGIASHA